MNKYLRAGIGTLVAKDILRLHRGNWGGIPNKKMNQHKYFGET